MKEGTPKRINAADKSIWFPLAQAAIQGSDEAFSKLYERILPSILFHAYGILRDYHEAEEAAQESVIKIYRSIKTLHSPEAFLAWMFQIVTRTCYNMRRGLRNEAEHYDIESYGEVLADDDEELLPPVYAERQDLRDRLRRIIDALPERERLSIILRYFHDMSNTDIAHALDISPGFVGKLLFQAKRKVRDAAARLVAEEKDEGKALAMGATPILAVLLEEKFNTEINPGLLDHFNVNYGKKLAAAGVPVAASGSAASPLLALLIPVIAIVGLTLAVVVGFQLGPNSAEPETPAAVEPIKYDLAVDNGGQCACGHLNPRSIVLEQSGADGQPVRWALTNAEGRVLYHGDGVVVREPFEVLYATGADGDYSIVFTKTETNGDRVDVKRDFHIDTGEILPGLYE